MRLRTSRERFSSASDFDIIVVANCVILWLGGKTNATVIYILVVNYETTAHSYKAKSKSRSNYACIDNDIVDLPIQVQKPIYLPTIYRPIEL